MRHALTRVPALSALLAATACARMPGGMEASDAAPAPADASAIEPDASECQPDASTSEPEGSATGMPGPKCTATPTLLVDLPALAAQVGATAIGAPGLAVDSASLYFVFNDTLMRVPLRGGPVVSMLPLPTYPGLILLGTDLLVTSTHVIVHFPSGPGDDESIVGVPKGGGCPTTLATSSGRILGFGGGEPSVVFVDGAGLKSVPASGGSVQILNDQLRGGGYGWMLAVVGSRVVATTSAQGGQIVAVPVQGGALTTLAAQQPNAALIPSCGADICWWTGPIPSAFQEANGPSPGPAYIARLAPRGRPTIVVQAPVYPWSLAFDGTDFFETVGCDECDGVLVRIPASGAAPVSMGIATQVAVDDTCAYWSTRAGISSAVKSYTAPGG
jgi:hypothetical protein